LEATEHSPRVHGETQLLHILLQALAEVMVGVGVVAEGALMMAARRIGPTVVE